jgi:5-methylcytosine-specific restriction endonuclease McrA
VNGRAKGRQSSALASPGGHRTCQQEHQRLSHPQRRLSSLGPASARSRHGNLLCLTYLSSASASLASHPSIGIKSMDTYAFGRLWHWTKRRHPNKLGKWRANAYWHPEQRTWQFATEHHCLLHYRSIPIQRHVKVQGTKSPFDGDWMDWTRRQGSHPDTPPNVAYLFKRQKGRCPFCGLCFREGDQLEVDHILPMALGGNDRYSNLQLLHGHCHDQKTAADGSLAARGAADNSQTIEEPNEVTSFTSGSEAERRRRLRRSG